MANQFVRRFGLANVWRIEARRNPESNAHNRVVLTASNSLRIDCRKRLALLGETTRSPQFTHFCVSRDKAHDACRALSDLYIQEGNLQSALKYAEVANVAFPYKSMCGLESMYFQDTVDRRIEELRSAIEYQTPVKLK